MIHNILFDKTLNERKEINNMYCVFDEDRIIAFHDEKRVVESYCESIQKYHDKNLFIAKIKKHKKKKYKSLSNYYDLYLVRYGDTFVQSGYVQYLEINSPQVEYDHMQAKDTLLRIMEMETLSEKEKKAYQTVVKSIDKIIKEDREYTPDLKELERMKDQYFPYIHNKEI